MAALARVGTDGEGRHGRGALSGGAVVLRIGDAARECGLSVQKEKKTLTMTTIPLFFTFDEHYVVPALVAFHSLLTNADRQYRYRLHVLHPGISEGARLRIAAVVAHFENAEVLFHDTSSYEAELKS